jgi:hypothetical protein
LLVNSSWLLRIFGPENSGRTNQREPLLSIVGIRL